MKARRIKNAKQLDKLIAEHIDYPKKHPTFDDNLICITGAKLPQWLAYWNPQGPDEEGRTLLYLPESGLSPLEQADYISKMHNPARWQQLRYAIVTYSPWIISDIKRTNVLVFGKGDIVEKPDINTFGASVNHITMSLLGRVHTMGAYSLKRFDYHTRRIQRAKDKKQFDDRMADVSRELGDTVEKTIFLHNFWDKEEKKTLNWQK